MSGPEPAEMLPAWLYGQLTAEQRGVFHAHYLEEGEPVATRTRKPLPITRAPRGRERIASPWSTVSRRPPRVRSVSDPEKVERDRRLYEAFREAHGGRIPGMPALHFDRLQALRSPAELEKSERPSHGPTAAVEVRVVEADAKGKHPPIPGAHVVLIRDRYLARFGDADDQGHYHATGLRPGSYTLEVSLRGYEPWKKEVAIGEHGLTREVREVLLSPAPVRPAATLHAPVTLSVDVAERTADGKLTPIADAKVVVRWNRASAAEGRPEAHAPFSTRLPPGTYSVEVSRPGYRTAYRQVRLAKDGASLHVLLEREAPPSVPSSLLTLTAQVWARDAGGQVRLVPNAEVQVRQAEQTVAHDRSGAEGDSKGTVRFHLKRGQYQVIAAKDGYHSGQAEAPLVKDGAPPVKVFLYFRDRKPAPTRTLTVEIQEAAADGKPQAAASALVVVSRGGKVVAQGHAAAVGNVGKFTVRLPYDDYEVTVTKEHHDPAVAKASLKADNARVGLLLTRRAGLRQVEVPLLVPPHRARYTEEEAQALLEKAGLRVGGIQETTESTTDPTRHNRREVTGQSVKAGTKVPAETAVGLSVVHSIYTPAAPPGPGTATLTVQVQAGDPDRGFTAVPDAVVEVRAAGNLIPVTSAKAGLFSTKLPVPFGRYEIEASATGYQAAQQEFVLRQDSTTAYVRLVHQSKPSPKKP
jgi:hypothetical protein